MVSAFDVLLWMEKRQLFSEDEEDYYVQLLPIDPHGRMTESGAVRSEARDGGIIFGRQSLHQSSCGPPEEEEEEKRGEGEGEGEPYFTYFRRATPPSLMDAEEGRGKRCQ